MNKDIYITEFDHRRAIELVQVSLSLNGKDNEYLESLEQELQRAHIVQPEAIPRDVVTMNSQIRLKDLGSMEERVYTLVFPYDADIAQNRISILAPIGTAMLGHRVGDLIEWPVPAGVRKLRVEEILYQPEAAGDFHL